MAFSKWVLNIGLIRSDGSGYVKIDDALTTLEREGCVVRDWRFWEADPSIDGDEDTLVVRMSADERRINPIVYQVSKALDQDCIAIHPVGDKKTGMLIGPRAAAWGEYNPAYFKEMFKEITA